jgi:hypothetical protein
MTDQHKLLEALALVAAGDWKGAHSIVYNNPSAEAAWVHGHLHRVDGDVENARYWYAKAEKPVAAGDLETERRAIETALKCAAN